MKTLGRGISITIPDPKVSGVFIEGMGYPIVVAVADKRALIVLALAGLSADGDAMVEAARGEGVAVRENTDGGLTFPHCCLAA